MEAIELARAIINILEEKLGEDIVLIDIQEQSDFTDYFVICSGTSDRMIKALVDSVADATRAKYRLKPRLEGEPGEGWVLADFGDVVVHFFSPARRNYYRLEELWSRGKVLLHVQ